MTRCEITSCKEPAILRFTFNHPDPSIRWTACLCMAHTNEAADKAAHGKGGYSLSPIEPTASTAGEAQAQLAVAREGLEEILYNDGREDAEQMARDTLAKLEVKDE